MAGRRRGCEKHRGSQVGGKRGGRAMAGIVGPRLRGPVAGEPDAAIIRIYVSKERNWRTSTMSIDIRQHNRVYICRCLVRLHVHARGNSPFALAGHIPLHIRSGISAPTHPSPPPCLPPPTEQSARRTRRPPSHGAQPCYYVRLLRQ